MANQCLFAPEFAIVLADGDSPRSIYTSGDRVKGQVVWNASRRLTVESIILQFKGVVKTQVMVSSGNSRRAVRGKAFLFDYAHTLSRTLHQDVGQSRSWDFDFVFPNNTPAASGNRWAEHPKFHHLPGHQLPPTWSSLDGRQQIYYQIKVSAHTPLVFRRPLKDRVNLIYSPYRSVQYPDYLLCKRTTTVVRTTRKLDSALPVQHRSVKESARSLFGSSIPSEPTSTFFVHSEVPRIVYVNGKLPIFIDIEHDLAKSTSREIPVIHLKDFHARLTEYTGVRVPNNHIRDSDRKITIDRRYYGRPLTERMNLGEAWNISIEGHIPPTFKTYSMSREYVLKVTATVVCARKEYEIELGRHGLLILPGPYRSLASIGPEVVPKIQAPPDDDFLPPYEKASAFKGTDAIGFTSKSV